LAPFTGAAVFPPFATSAGFFAGWTFADGFAAGFNGTGFFFSVALAAEGFFAGAFAAALTAGLDAGFFFPDALGLAALAMRRTPFPAVATRRVYHLRPQRNGRET
jgi:hypothetical protein